MIAENIHSRTNQEDVKNAMERAYAFLARKALGELPEGRVDLGNGVVANIQHYVSVSPEQMKFETHERNIDIQYVIEGEEIIYVTNRKNLDIQSPYDTQTDMTFYADADASSQVLLRSGDFVALFPEDAHKPRCLVHGPVPVKKIVIKIPVKA